MSLFRVAEPNENDLVRDACPTSSFSSPEPPPAKRARCRTRMPLAQKLRHPTGVGKNMGSIPVAEADLFFVKRL